MIPENFQIFMWVFVAIALISGAIYFGVWLASYVEHQIYLFVVRRKTDEDMIRSRSEHAKRLLDLDFEKAKAVNESRTRQAIINSMKEE